MTKSLKSTHLRTSTRRPGNRLTAAQRITAQLAFLHEYEQCSTILDACTVANIDRSTFHNWLEHDEEFSILYHQAKASSDDVIRRAIKRRAIDGWEEPVVSMGKVVYHNKKPLTVKKYSDALLALLARSRMPEYRDKSQLDVKAQVSRAASDAYAHLSDDELDDIERILLTAQERMQHHD